MSQTAAVRATARSPRPGTRAPRPGPASAAPRLRVVAAPRHTRSRAGLVIGCLVLLGAGLIGLLVLNVSLERGAYELRSQRSQTVLLVEKRQQLQEQLAAMQAPGQLAATAEALGMVNAPNVAFLRRSDGAVLGVPSPGVAGQAPSVGTAAGPPVAVQPALHPKGTTGIGGIGTAVSKLSSAAARAATTAAVAAGSAAASSSASGTGTTGTGNNTPKH